MTGHTVILESGRHRTRAHTLIDVAPLGCVVTVTPPKRTIPQNDKMWAMLSDVSRSKPGGRKHTPDVWKALFMNACGWECSFEMGLDGRPFPLGFRSSKLTKSQMADLITFIQAWGDENGVAWSDEKAMA